jgi:hypothetical protein
MERLGPPLCSFLRALRITATYVDLAEGSPDLSGGMDMDDFIRKKDIPVVPDRRRRIVPEVVLVRRWVIGVLGIWRGEGLGKGLGQGRSVYKQPETEVDGSCHS